MRKQFCQLAALIFCGYNHGTEFTIVNGKVVVDKGVIAGFDEEELIRKSNEISAKIME